MSNRLLRVLGVLSLPLVTCGISTTWRNGKRAVFSLAKHARTHGCPPRNQPECHLTLPKAVGINLAWAWAAKHVLLIQNPCLVHTGEICPVVSPPNNDIFLSLSIYLSTIHPSIHPSDWWAVYEQKKSPGLEELTISSDA